MISKKFEIKKDPALVGYVARLFITAFIISLYIPGSGAAKGPETKILILPFHLSETDENRELITFKEYVGAKLRESIESAGARFRLKSKSTAMHLIKDKGVPKTEEDIKGLRAVTDADFVIFGSVAEGDNQYKFRGYMWQARERRMVVSAEFSVAHVLLLARALNQFCAQVLERLEGSPNIEFYPSESPAYKDNPKKTEFKPVSIDKETGPWRSPNIPEALLSLDIGDLDGDGKNETVFLSKGQATIRKFESGALKTLIRFSHPPVAYVSAEVEDIDLDGVAELLLIYQKPDGLESAIITYKDRDFKISQTFPNMLLATIDDPVFRGRKALVGQRTDKKDMFDGSMVRMRVVDAKAEPFSEITLPPGTLLMSYASGRLGESKRNLRIILNQDQRLMVFDEENRLLSSVQGRSYGIDRRLTFRVDGQERTIVFPGRLAIVDTNGDGARELLVSKQTARGSVVEDLIWQDNTLKQKWKTVDSAGIISDFRVRDFKNQGARSLVLILMRSTTFPLMALSGPTSVVYAYELGR
jgi:hypothetical protein